MPEERRLGRGLDSLISRGTGDTAQSQEGLGVRESLNLPLSEIRENPFQPRQDFDEARIADLAASMKSSGVLQPVVVRRVGNQYQLVSGARRLRAARQAGLATLPAILRDVTDSDMLSLALVENLQREDLNPIEKAKGFQSLIQRFHLTQEEVAQRVGLDRSSVANLLRLLDLPKSIQDDVSRGTIAMGHARALLAIRDSDRQLEIAERIKREDLSVRRVEKMVASERGPVYKPAKKPHITDLENRLRERLGGRVEVSERQGKGRIVIHFSNLDDLDRILEAIGA